MSNERWGLFLFVLILGGLVAAFAGMVFVLTCSKDPSSGTFAEFLLVFVLAAEGAFAWLHFHQAKDEGRAQRQEQYYIRLSELFSEHNWRMLENEAPSGMPYGQSGPLTTAIFVVALDHVNLLFFAWAHKDILADSDLAGYRRWASLIVKGASQSGDIFENFRKAYLDILAAKDLYPSEFLLWLEDKVGFSKNAFERNRGEVPSN